MVQLTTVVSTLLVATSLIPSVVVAVPIQSSPLEAGLTKREPSHRYADSPIRGAVIGGHKRELEHEELIARLEADELAELVRRNPEPFFGLFKLAAKGIGALVNKIKNKKKKRDLGDLEDLELISRAEPEELAALIARNPEPFLPFLGLRLAAGLLKHHKRGLSSGSYEDVLEREFAQLELEMREVEDVENIEMREYDEDEMAARGWTELEQLD
ncbi:hypothetical protein BKA70DRAFT_1307344 [Coprinopsis sp. MPI-PUGE-AT-0042]|nr:hypothetical protein BKA70DRAFT_1307344 [Coprinopsis sp. MPI-PUGE-AT-0042]